MAQIIRGDCVEVMARMEAGSVDAICTDPPYGLEFMGKEWDAPWKDERTDKRGVIDPAEWGGQQDGSGGNAFSRSRVRTAAAHYGGDAAKVGQQFQTWCETWAAECLRVLKPGGYLLAFGGTRMYHRLACAVEDVGFEIRDRILVEGVEVEHPTELAWMYGSGFPKSLDVSKAIDKDRGRGARVSEGKPVKRMIPGADQNGTGSWIKENGREFVPTVTEPATEDAARWAGWGTALKPAHEPIVVARKPLGERNVAANVLKHGTGGLNVDATRIEGVVPSTVQGQSARQGEVYGADQRDQREFVPNGGGRWPANVVLVHSTDCALIGTKQVRAITGTSSGDPDGHGIYGTGFPRGDKAKLGKGDEDGMETVEEWECVEGCPVRELDEQSGQRTSGKVVTRGITVAGYKGMVFGAESRSAGPVEWYGDTGGASRFFYTAKAARGDREAGLLGVVPCARCGGLDTVEHEIEGAPGVCIRNDHPTVKPIEVMRWLVRLVTPPDGVVLDPFMGSGTTGIACELEGFAFVGVELGERSAQIAEARVAFWREHGEDGLVTIRAQEALERRGVERREELESAGQSSLFD